MKAVMLSTVGLILYLVGMTVVFELFFNGCSKNPQESPVALAPKDNEVTECVEQIVYRTELKHDGCPSNGFWRVSGQAKKVEVTDPPAMFWPHACSGCGATQAMVNVCWPKFKREWRAVK